MKQPHTPCGSCPYRCDVPSGVWHQSEYEKLPPYDNDTQDQPPAVFMCHQQDGAVCSGWAHHADDDTLSLRLAVAFGHASPEMVDFIVEYTSPVELWDSHTEAAEHGMREYIESQPSRDAERVQRRLNQKGIGSAD